MATIMNLYVAIIAISAVTHTTLCAKLSNRRQIEDSPLYTFTGTNFSFPRVGGKRNILLFLLINRKKKHIYLLRLSLADANN